jgi:endonuclease YncB( thermonuclease family)
MRPRRRKARAAPRLSLVGGLALVLAAAPAGPATEALPGPISAHVLAVLDGDTFDARARIWLNQDIRVRVRIIGIDAPELRAGCPAEKALAEQARDLLEAKIGEGLVVMRQIRHGKYAGRVLARVSNAAGEDLAEALLAAGLARVYQGGARATWCGS